MGSKRFKLNGRRTRVGLVTWHAGELATADSRDGSLIQQIGETGEGVCPLAPEFLLYSNFPFFSDLLSDD